MKTFLCDVLKAAHVTTLEKEIAAAKANGEGMHLCRPGLVVTIGKELQLPDCMEAKVVAVYQGKFTTLACCWQSAESFGMAITTATLNSTDCCEGCSYELEFLVDAAHDLAELRKNGLSSEYVQLIADMAAATAKAFGLEEHQFPAEFLGQWQNIKPTAETS